jgi:alpha-beta hydrolase superfamily lysophospholipase
MGARGGIGHVGPDTRPTSAWDDASTWTGDGLRREVFFFPSDGVRLYGSLYAAASPGSSLGVLLCGSWGFEGDLASRLLHPLALSVARAGGSAALFHYPGTGDSYGDLGDATMEGLARSAANALRESARRRPGTRWILAGTMLGASVACLVAEECPQVERLLLVQPALRPSAYFARLERTSRRAIGELGSRRGFAHGYPLPAPMLESAARADAAVAAALGRFRGPGAAVAHAAPAAIERLPERFERVRVPGTWRFGAKNLAGLAGAAGEWLRPLIRGGG